MARIPLGNFTFSKLWLNCHPKVKDLSCGDAEILAVLNGEHQNLDLKRGGFCREKCANINQPCFRTGKKHQWNHLFGDLRRCHLISVSILAAEFFKYCSNFKSQISSNIMPRCDFKPQISNIIPQMCDITAFNFIQRLRVKVWILDPGPKCSQGVRRPGVQTVQFGLISGIFQSIWGHNR